MPLPRHRAVCRVDDDSFYLYIGHTQNTKRSPVRVVPSPLGFRQKANCSSKFNWVLFWKRLQHWTECQKWAGQLAFVWEWDIEWNEFAVDFNVMMNGENCWRCCFELRHHLREHDHCNYFDDLIISSDGRYSIMNFSAHVSVASGILFLCWCFAAISSWVNFWGDIRLSPTGIPSFV